MRHPKERSGPGGISRREFLRRSAGTAFALSGAGALLAACGHASDPNNFPGLSQPSPGATDSSPFPLARPDHPVTWPIPPDNQPIASGLPLETGATLQIYNWDQYLWTKLTKDFAKKYNCKVQITTLNGTDEAIAKLRTGQVDFDVYFPDPSLLGRLITAKLLQPLNHDYIPNLRNCWPQYQNPFYDRGSRYTVPYTVYTTGIGYRRDKLPFDPGSLANPYDLFWNPAFKGKINLLDDYRETIVMALLKHGITDVNTSDPAKVLMAKADLVKLINTVAAKLDVNDYTTIPEGSSWIHQAWSGSMTSAQYYLPKGVPIDVLGFWYPPNGGGAIGSDNIAIPTTAKNPVLAHTFINFMLDAKNAYANFVNFNGYQPPQNDINVARLVSDGVIPENLAATVVTPKHFDTCHFILELSPTNDALWHRAFQEIQAGG